MECVECKKLGCPTEGMTLMCPGCAGVICAGHVTRHRESCERVLGEPR